MDRLLRHMAYCLVLLAALVSGCAVVPYPDEFHVSDCPTRSRQQTLRLVNVLTEAQSDGLSSYLLSPIVVPVSAVVSGSYVLGNNLYNELEQAYKCGGESSTASG